jgi:hypothetical protein
MAGLRSLAARDATAEPGTDNRVFDGVVLAWRRGACSLLSMQVINPPCLEDADWDGGAGRRRSRRSSPCLAPPSPAANVESSRGCATASNLQGVLCVAHLSHHQQVQLIRRALLTIALYKHKHSGSNNERMHVASIAIRRSHGTPRARIGPNASQFGKA